MNIALILAAGSGTRMGNTNKPKQFLSIYNKPLIVHTIEAFEMHDDIDMILIVTNDTYIDDVKIWCKQYDLTKVQYIVAGGSSRQESVYNGLKKLEKIGAKDDDIILIHDAARPLISQTIITDNIESCKKYHAVDTVIPSSDTIIRSIDKETICEIQKRSEQYQGQTPQSFTFKVINDAHEYAKSINNTETTDDCRLVLNMGKEVHLVNGSKLNFKITTFDDLMMLKALLKIGKTGVM
ncbi:MAG: 2-C-methyl-D-erythritol 4-phosphate cytidylyltransferase [Erysipelotrichaceae bacterium]|nr:2-C-methyl-D-erythritol 4-phosphate cytidylyltransferase [Erysipelotrichaceae bacterium]